MLLALLAPVTVVAQQQQTTATTITLQSAFDPNACFGWDAHGGDVTLTLATFTDPLPPASLLRSASITWPLGNDKEFSFQLVPAVTLFINGTQLGPQQVIGNYNGCIPGASIPYVFSSDDYPQGFPGYVYGGLNTATFDLQAGNIHPTGPAVLTLTFVPPNPFEFNVTDQASETERRVLLSNLQSGYPYPQFQALGGVDSKVPMFVRARGRDGQFDAGLTVYLRIDDPPDTAPYTNLSQNILSHPNDNAGPPAQLEGLTATATAGVYQGTTTTNGELDFVLALQPRTAAGDNFQVEASFDPTFPPGATTKSGTLTAWKRVFVDKHRMLRNGIRLLADAPAGSSILHINGNRYGGNQNNGRVSRGDLIALVHAPRLDRSDALFGWYTEYHRVADVQAGTMPGEYVVTLGTRAHGTITPELLTHDFTTEPLDPQVGDGIARVGSVPLTSADYFEAVDTLVTDPSVAFQQAYTEYIILLDATFGVPLPYVLANDDIVLVDLAERWSPSVSFSDLGPLQTPNTQLLLIGDNDGQNPASQAGQTSYGGNGIASIVYRGTIDAQVRLQGPHHHQNPDNWAAKTEAHELTHQWQVDGAWASTPHVTPGHCPLDSTAFDDATVYCLEATASDTGSETQSDNMIAKFHLRQDPTGTWQSEYFEIRRRVDPFVP